MTKLVRMAVPTGSLLERARTDLLLAEAGLNIKGYYPGMKDFKLSTKSYDVEPVPQRPQEMPEDLFDGKYDLAICASDCVENLRLAGKKVIKLADLDYGDSRLVYLVKEGTNANSINDFLRNRECQRTEFSVEFVNLTYYNLLRNKVYRKLYGRMLPTKIWEGKSVDKKSNPDVIIKYSYGSTESKIVNGLVDCIGDVVSSGETMEKNRLKIIGNIFKRSVAGLYANENSLKDEELRSKIRTIEKSLCGVIKGQKNYIALINTPRGKLEELRAYLRKRKFTAKGPGEFDIPGTFEGKRWMDVVTEVPKDKWFYFLEEMGKLGIDDVARIATQQIITRSQNG